MSSIVSLLPTYLIWHYSLGLHDVVRTWRELFYFIGRFFSFKLLLKTLFDPFERLNGSYKKGFNLENVASTFVSNTIVRLVGFLVRFITIVIGSLVEVAWCVFGLLFVVFWVTLPFSICLLVWFMWTLIKI